MTTNDKRGKQAVTKVCKFLNTVYNESFVPTPNSGARVGGKNSGRKEILTVTQNKAFTSDIITPDTFELTIEVKNNKRFPFHKLFMNCPELNIWIEQIKHDCKNNKWVIFFNVNFLGLYVVLPDVITLYDINTFTYYYGSEVFHIVEANTLFTEYYTERLKTIWSNEHN